MYTRVYIYIFYTSVSFLKWFVLHIVGVMCIYKYINIWFAPPRPRIDLWWSLSQPNLWSIQKLHVPRSFLLDPGFESVTFIPGERYTVFFLGPGWTGDVRADVPIFFTHWNVSFLRVRFYSSEIDVFMAIR